VDIKDLSIHGAYEIVPSFHLDDRGAFWEWYRFDKLEEVLGYPLNLQQANGSISKQGVLRGLHFADVDPGQAKYVTCVNGEVLDFIVDIRIGSPTFGKWESISLTSKQMNSVYIAEGLGHAFLALTEGAVVNYLVSGVYNPSKEHGVNPLDPAIGLVFPAEMKLTLSEKDQSAPTLTEATAQGILPTWEEAMHKYENLSLKGDAK
jgi:dTDP-4-dehydrorhamnose 3,5-epimerase